MPPKFCILLWKDLMHRRHKPFYTFLEIITLIALTIWASMSDTTTRDTFRTSIILGPRNFKSFGNTWGKSIRLLHEPKNQFLDSFMQEIKYGLGISQRPFTPIDPVYRYVNNSVIPEDISRRRIVGRSYSVDGGIHITNTPLY